jgi:small subunit ribosomal protein S35
MCFAAFRKPFVPPTAGTPLVIRSVDYAGEEHPLTTKRTVVVPVAELPLRGDLAVHKIKLLAGARWTLDPSKGAGVPLDTEQGMHGYIKIACEDFPQPAMNLKWISDTIDGLISTANVRLYSSTLFVAHQHVIAGRKVDSLPRPSSGYQAYRSQGQES